MEKEKRGRDGKVFLVKYLQFVFVKEKKIIFLN